jgi:hypothetical protein
MLPRPPIAERRWGGWPRTTLARVDLDQAEPTVPETDEDLLALDEALERLAKSDPVKA